MTEEKFVEGIVIGLLIGLPAGLCLGWVMYNVLEPSAVIIDRNAEGRVVGIRYASPEEVPGV